MAAQRPATEQGRKRSRFGSRRRSSVLVNASSASRLSVRRLGQRSPTRLNPAQNHATAGLSGPCPKPVSLAVRIRSFQRTRRRCRTSKVGRFSISVLVTNAVRRRPSRSAKRSSAPGQGRFLRSMRGIPAGVPGVSGCQYRDPGTIADSAAEIEYRHPHVLGNIVRCVSHRLGQGEPDQRRLLR